MTSVVGEVQDKVVSVCDLKLFHSLSGVTDLADCLFNLVLGLHESSVFCLDLGDNFWGVDLAFPVVPLDSLLKCISL